MDSVNQIKSYLVGLGFEVDDTTYRKFVAAIDGASQKIEKHTGLMSNSYMKASVAVISAVGTVITSVSMLLDSLAKADLGYQKYALHMFMAKDAAKEFQIVTKAMGESLEDIAWIPELHGRYVSLMGTAAKMELPKDYGSYMLQIRDLRGEFTRLKVEATYGLEWIGYNIAKNLSGGISGATKSFKEFNEYFATHIAEWSKKVADKLTPVFVSLWEILKNIGAILKIVGDAFSAVMEIFAHNGEYDNATTSMERFAAALAVVAKNLEYCVKWIKELAPYILTIGGAIIGAKTGGLPGALIGAAAGAALQYKIDIGNDAQIKNDPADTWLNRPLRKSYQFLREHLSGSEEAKAAGFGMGGIDIAGIRAFGNKLYGMGTPSKLLDSVTWAESNNNPNAVSNKGAMGAYQFTGATARAMGLKNPFDPVESRGAANKLLSSLHSKYGSWELALAAYNAGEPAVDKYGGIPPFPETQNYVNKIMHNWGGQSGGGNVNNNFYITVDNQKTLEAAMREAYARQAYVSVR